MATIVDVARRSGVSITTVSRVLNDSGYPVRAETRRKVLEAIEELQFRPNALARGLLLKETHVIGLLVPDITNPYFPILSRGVEDAANTHGYEVIFCNTDHNPEKTARYVDVLLRKQVDGIIAAGSIGMDESHGMGNDPTRVVLAGRYDPAFACVVVDNVAVAREATNHLITLGHRRIAHITGATGRATTVDRIIGHHQALDEHGIQRDECLTYDGNFDEQGGYQAARALLPLRPTAIFAGNDRMAIGAMAAAIDSGLQVPRDLSIVSCDDITMASYVRPALTTVRIPIYNLGAVSMQTMLSLLGGADVPPPIYLPTTLEIRASTAPPRDETNNM